jgi:hypothetical protein
LSLVPLVAHPFFTRFRLYAVENCSTILSVAFS